MSGDRPFTVPGNTAFQFVVNSVHRNPKYWPSGPVPPGKKNDLDEFRPQRWLLQKSTPPPADRNHSSQTVADEKQAGVAMPEEVLSADTSAALFRPFPGAYIPFSAGHRRCIGRRFAQVELLAVLAVLLKSYSLELDVADFADDKAVKAMSAGERKKVWERAAKRMTGILREDMRHHLTMQLKAGRVTVRLVVRGEERFP
jgi:cytochrome P450